MANTNKKSSLNKFLVGPHDYTSTQILYLWEIKITATGALPCFSAI